MCRWVCDLALAGRPIDVCVLPAMRIFGVIVPMAAERQVVKAVDVFFFDFVIFRH